MSGEDYEVDDLEKWANEEDDFTDNESGVEFDDEEEGIYLKFCKEVTVHQKMELSSVLVHLAQKEN